MRNLLDGHIQRAVVNGLKCWRTSMTSSVLQGSILGQMLFNTFVNHTHERNECTLSRFAGDTKLNGVVATSEWWDANQTDLDKLEKWVPGNLMRFKKIRCKMLHLGLDSPCGANTAWGMNWKIFSCYNTSMRVQDSFTTILCDGNNLTYTIISCNSYQETIVQRHTQWFHNSAAKVQHLYLLLFMCGLYKCFKDWQRPWFDLWKWAFATIRSLAGIQISKLILFSISSIPFPALKLGTLMSLVQSSVYFVMW